MAALSEPQIGEQLKKVSTGWTREGNTIKKQYTFGDFPAAVAFVLGLGL